MIKVVNLSKKIKNKTIFANVNCTINQGDVIGVVGENGSGKSTLIKVLLGLFQKSQGEINKAQMTVDYFPDISNMVSNLRVDAYINYYCALNGLSQKTTITKITVLAEKLDLTSKLKSNFKTLSTGEKKRVYILMLLLFKKDLIFFDEPTDNLDEKYNELFVQVIKNLIKKQVTLVIISHNYEFLEKIITKLLILQDTQVIFNGPFLPGQRIRKVWEEAKKQVNPTFETNLEGNQNGLVDW